MSEEGRKILVITADAVKYTGAISFMFMTEAAKKADLRPMPSKYGYVWKPDPGGKNYAINVFEGGKGVVLGAGWGSDDDFPFLQEIFDSIPSCTLLMDIDLLPWWQELTQKHGVEFQHHHHEGILRSS